MSRMGSSRLWGKIIVLVAVWCCALSAQAKYSGGSGTEAEPFRISAVPDWQELMATPADWASHFVLTADIDLNDVPITPVGNITNEFTGVFDGNDFDIRNVDVNVPGSDYVGLFGYLGTDGQIRNLRVEDVSIRGRSYLGGLVGRNSGTIINCYSDCSVGGNYCVGGLAGGNYDGTIINCYSSGLVSGSSGVGGLVGENGHYSGGGARSYFGWIHNCYSNGFVSSTGTHVGGLVGLNYGSIVSSFWDVNTSGWTTSDGGTGRTTPQMQDVNTFLDAGWDFLGETANGTCNFWLMPQSGGYPVLSTLNGYIPVEPSGSGSEADPYIITDTNGLGTVWYRPSGCYVMANDIDLVGISWSGAVVPFFSGVFDGNDHTLRNVDVNVPAGDYVGLFGYLGTNGELKNLGVQNISILGRDYVGGFVGYSEDYAALSHCHSSGSVTGRDYVGGLMGWNRTGAISNCGSTGSVTGMHGVGGLVGLNEGRVSNCGSTGSVTGMDGVGGLVGGNEGRVNNSYSSGTVSGNGNYVGGLVGGNHWTISNCYSTASASGTDYVGGLAGSTYNGAISNCYSTGSVSGTGSYVGGLLGRAYGSVVSGFWDVNTSSWTTSAGGTPKTTAEMKAQSTFTSAGWDFIEVWDIGENQTYPFIRAYLAGDINHDGVIDFRDIAYLAESWLSGL